MKDISLYIHIPFCVRKCAYCNFLSFDDKKSYIEPYLNALCRELELWGERAKDCSVISVYIGGGTPSILSLKQLKKLTAAIGSCFTLDPYCEVTLEMNPAAHNHELINGLRSAGINRVSVGLQTHDDSILKEINRPHTKADYIATVKRLQRADIGNINTDIMLGLPHQNLAIVRRTLELLLELEIPHISAYGLKVEKGTPLYRLVRNDQILLPCEDESVNMYDAVYDTLEKNKIYRYEVSNFSKVGYECRHNINYWSAGRYIGIGLNSHGYMGDMRYSNLKDIDRYITRIGENKRPISVRNKISLKDAEFEFIMLALRMDRGLDIDTFNALFYSDFIKRYKLILDKLERIGVIVYDRHNVAVRKEKMYLLNSILVEFME